MALHRITVGLSMACFGFYAQEHHGGIYRHGVGDGAQYISVFADGVTRGTEEKC